MPSPPSDNLQELRVAAAKGPSSAAPEPSHPFDLAAAVAALAGIVALLLAMPFGRPLAGPYATAVAVLLAGSTAVARVRGTVVLRGLAPVVAFAVAGVASMAASRWTELSFARAGQGLVLMLVFAAAQVVAASAAALRGLRWACGISVALVIADVVAQYAFGRSLLLGVPAPVRHARYAGSLPNPNEIAAIVTLLPLACASAVRWRSLALGAAAFAAAGFAVLLSGSRAALAGLLVAACATAAAVSRRLVLLAAACALAGAGVALALDLGAVRERALESVRFTEDSRLRVWRVAWEAFLERPLLGQGPSVFFEVHEASRRLPQPPGWETSREGMPWAHSVPLELLCERGVIGAALFAWLLWTVARALRCALRDDARRAHAQAVLAALVAISAMSLVDLSLMKDWCATEWWLVSGLACAAGGAASRAECPRG